MAAKQGITAHLSQASEDARRAVLSRAPTSITSHSWLSNLNTTCTLKSAPPRTPEVMTLLSTKSGWLVKRNEQQVWQRRWCCVVPHTHLYYFEAEPVRDDGDDGTREGFSGGGLYRSGAVVENQEQLNDAVRDGCKGKFRETTPLKGKDTNALYNSPSSTDKITPTPMRGPTTTNGNLSPAGIIDLECYTCINRSSRNELVFELTGDEITNPDLRSFYFQAGSVEDCETWTNSLLSDRHSALRDERDAYRQVCDSFQLQLQNLSDMIDEAEGKTAETENQLYNVRSASEKFRTQIVTIVREALEQNCWKASTEPNKISDIEKLDDLLEKTRLFYLDQIDEIISSENIGTTQNTGALITRVLADYLNSVIGTYTEMGVQVKSMEHKLSRSAGVDKAAMFDLQRKVENLETEKVEREIQNKTEMDKLTYQLYELQKANEELENQMQTQRVEFSMFQNQAKSKLKELSQHKKILKKEVIDLRKNIDELGSERDAALHITDSHKVQAETEKEKNEMLEKYIERMENQVVVQQNMMEMISLSGMSQIDDGEGASAPRSNSVVGRIIAAPDDGSLSSFGPRHYKVNLRDASPYRLPPKARTSVDNPPLSPAGRKPPSSTPGTPRQRKQSNRRPKQPSYSDPKKKHVSQNTPRRGTLDHELLGHQSDNIYDRETEIKAGESQLTHDERVTRFHGALNKASGRSKTNTNRVVDDLEDEHDDHKSVFSELTEDRTQRAFESKVDEPQEIIQYNMSDRTGENVFDGVPEINMQLAQPQVENDVFPPRYIIGAAQSENNDDREDMYSTKSNAASTSNVTRLSVAQKARLAAEQNGNKVDVSAEAETIKLREAKEREQVLKTPPRTRSQSPGMFSNLASMIGKKKETTPQNRDRTLTLAERQQQQKERQLHVLREQGLLKDGEDSISGGPGAPTLRSISSQRSRA